MTVDSHFFSNRHTKNRGAKRSWWHITDGRLIVRHVIHEAGAFGIDVLIIARREMPPAEAHESSAAKES